MKFLSPKIVLVFLLLSSLKVVAQDSILLSLNAAIELAIEKNRDIVISNYQTNSFEYALKEAKGNFLPNN